MKITIETEHCVATVDEKGAEDFGQLLEMFKQCAVGAGFHPNTVREYLPDEVG